MIVDSFTWLHLSDLHFKAHTDWRRDVVLQALVRDVIAKLPGSELEPDAVFITGDIAYSGLREEYDQAQLFLDEVALKLNHHPSEKWFLAPGNHDVNRQLVMGLAKGYRNQFTDNQTTRDLLSDLNTWRSFSARQQEFLRFTSEFLGPGRAWSAQTPWRTDLLKKDGLHLAVLCLNSAWASQDDEDQGKLLMGEYQVRDALKKAEDAHFKIGLFHHPLSWLREFDAKAVSDLLTGPRGCHLLLRGHLHETELGMRIKPGSHTFDLATGACWQGSDFPHSVMVGQLDFKQQTVAFHVWSYVNKEGGFWTKDTQYSQAMPDGVWRESFPKQWHFEKTTATRPKKESASKDTEPIQEPLIPKPWRDELERCCGRHENLIEAEQPLVTRLRDVYVPLKTGWIEPKKRKALAKLKKSEQVEKQEPAQHPLADLLTHDKHRHFLVVGGPGAGKSTFVRFSALDVLQNEHQLLPLLLPLKEFGDWLKDAKGKKSALLSRWASAYLADFGLENLEARLGQGQVLWLLDGLDEIFDQQLRLRAAQIIGAFVRDTAYGADRLLLTSRPHALEQNGVRAALDMDEREASILSFDAEDQRLFLLQWFRSLYPEGGASGYRDDLWHKMARNHHVSELSGTPLLLSMIATLYHLGKNLPERRADLYEKAVWNLLQRRYGPHGRSNGGERLVREMRQALMKTARWIQTQGGAREISEPDLLRLLKDEPDPDWREWASAEMIAVDLGAHSGLLTMKGGRFGFVHLGFQEFLAARSITFDEDPLKTLKPYLKESAWREVVLLTVGHLYENGSVRTGADIIKALAQHSGSDCANLAFAVEAAAQAPKGELGALEKELKRRSLDIIEDAGSGSEKQRFDLGLALGYLGDPRLGLTKLENWILVDEDVRLSRFLVTIQDYKLFIEAGGYTSDVWWDEEGWEWLVKEMPDPENRFPAFWWNKDWNAPNQPVVGVSWYEARAFCCWLSTFLRSKADWFDPELAVDLPSDEIWGLAAGEGKREFPWGDETLDATRANYDGRLRRTSSVGLYPHGATSDELFDLAGNVWEWTLELDKDGGSILLGGSWILSGQSLTSADRGRSRAGYRHRHVGFRVCLAPRA